MGSHDYSIKIRPKYMDADNEARYMDVEQKGAVRYLLNVRLGSSANSSIRVLENIKGNIEIPNNLLPSGRNKCV
ncbi:MAG: hypothetical protein KDC67_13360, partial [Ignavibacteriae bacterium]|nr:hypothetical protein [Ignavibacteriota bacterium]